MGVLSLNKRAVGTGFLVKAIFAIAVMVIIIVFALYYILPWLMGTSDEQLCQQSVTTRAATIIKVGGFQPDLGLMKELNCKTKYVVVKDGGIYVKDKLSYSFDEKNRDTIIKKTIADEMMSCWKMMGKGELEIWGGAGSNIVHCIICSEIIFDMKKPPETVANFNDYLKSTRISSTSKETYASFFNFKADELTEYNINPGVPLDIVYIQTDHAGALGEFWGDFKSGCKKGGRIASFLDALNPIPIASFVDGCILGGASNLIKSNVAPDETIQPMILVLPATEFQHAKCDTTY